MKNVFVFTALIFALGVTSFAVDKSASEVFVVQVTDKGFEPDEIKVKTGAHVTLKITRKTDSTCATEVVVKEKKIKKDLPLNEEVIVDLGKIKKGETKFSCAMNMITGHVIGQ